jgi:hypothetical protein
MTSTTKAPRKTAASKGPKVSRASAEAPTAPHVTRVTSGPEVLVIGGEPRVHLLPPQVLARKRGKALRRRLGLGLVGIVILVAAGLGLATISMISSQSALLAAQEQTTSILQQQAKYGEVLKVKADVSSIQSSQKLATAQEIAWQPYIADLQSTLPVGGSITALTAGIDAPFATPPAVTDPLQGPRIASLTVTVMMPQATISGWLDSLPKLKGFVDETPNSVTLDPSDSNYTVAVTMHINTGALANRFTKNAGNN